MVEFKWHKRSCMTFLIKNSCHLPIPSYVPIEIRQANSNCNITYLQCFYALGCSDSCKNGLVSWEESLVSSRQGSFLDILSSRRSSALALLFVLHHALCFPPQAEIHLQVQFLRQWREKKRCHIYCLFHKKFPWKMFWSCFHAD